VITELRIKNFKCFSDTQPIKIRPLTFLVGPNSSGKSSVLKALLMLKQTIESTDITNPLVANGGWIEMGAYPEFIFRNDFNKNLEIAIEFDLSNSADVVRSRYLGREMPAKFSFNTTFNYNRETTQIELKEIELDAEDIDLHSKIQYNHGKSTYSLSIDYNENGERKRYVYPHVKPIKFYDCRPIFRSDENREVMRSMRRLPIFNFGSSIEREFHNLFYLGPLRDFPRRIYGASGQAPQDVGIRGERALEVLRISGRNAQISKRNVERQAKKWLKLFNIADDIQLDQIVEAMYYIIFVIDSATKTRVNLADIGFGASQTLPIIIQSFYAPPQSLLLIEQPEIHLHPKAQSILGDLFIEAANGSDRSFIIETHSEHILSRVRRRMAEHKVKCEDVAIYYFEPSIDGTIIRNVTLNDQGQYLDFPEGFFEEELDESFAHLKAMREFGSDVHE
jgi:predicted ATPase